LAFLEYYDFPGMIGERFRRVFDVEDTGYIAKQSFIKTMRVACLGYVNEKINIVFQMLDFDNDGYVSKTEVSALLLHVPLYQYNVYEKSIIPKDSNNQEAILARQKSQDELADMLVECFKDDYITLKQFEHVTLTKASDIFVSIFYILLTKFPTLSELYMSSVKESDSTKSNEISTKKSDLPPARRMSNLWPIKEIYSKKSKIIDFPSTTECKQEEAKEEENVPEDIDEDTASKVISSTFNSNDIRKIEGSYSTQKTHREVTLGFLQFNKNVIRSGSLRSGKIPLGAPECRLEKISSLKQSTFQKLEEKHSIKEIQKIPSLNHIFVEDFNFKKSETIMECLYENNLLEGELGELENGILEMHHYVIKGKIRKI
jgi:Ca2+-binding EF-hand superfamily protein